MENAVDALKLGAFVIIFVIALSVSITAFSEARIAASTLLEYKDREASLGQNDYWYSNESSKKRIVGLETIIPAIYRAYSDESLKIVFLDNDKGTKKVLYKIKNNDGTLKDINTLGYIYDSKLFGLTPKTKIDFINKILYNKDSSYTNDLKKIKGIDYTESLYEYIKENSFLEFSGIYISGEENGITEKPISNKESIGVITYQRII